MDGRVSGARALARGLTRRCPRCGHGRLFTRWFTLAERCPRCGLHLLREQGAFLGAMTINYAVTAAVWLMLLVVWLVVSLPGLEVGPLLAASMAVAVMVPLAFYPFSKTIWAAIEYLVRRPEDG